MLVQYLEVKLQLFGPKLLTRAVRLSDLSDDDMDCLRNGANQLLPVRDQSGRAVVCILQNHNKYKSGASGVSVRRRFEQ